MESLPRMRNVKELVAMVKESDPNTSITEYTIRKLITSGELPCVRTGRKILISVEVFERFLRGEKVTEPMPEIPPEIPRVKRIYG